jgi:AraC family transcriptional regulator
MATLRAPGGKLTRLDEASSAIAHSIWLDGPQATAEGIGARGYAYAPYTQAGDPVAVEPHVLILYVKGRTSIHRTIADSIEREEVGPGDLSLQSTATPTWWAWSSAIEVLHVYISPQHLRAMAQRAFGRDINIVRLHNRLRVTDPQLMQLGFDLIGELTLQPPGYEVAARAIGDRLLVQLLRAHAELERRREARTFDAPTVARIEAFVAEHLADRLELPRLARVAGYAVHHFCRLFRQTFAQAPHDFVRTRRLALAKRLLVETSRSLSEVAIACGFADQSHMTRVFKEHVGVTPARFRCSTDIQST